jgi:hypothetical protein
MDQAGPLTVAVGGAIFLGLVTAFGWTAIEIVTRQSLDVGRLPKIVGWSAVGWFLVAWAMAAAERLI